MSFNISSPMLKGIFFIHFVLTTWAIQPSWLPNSYVFYNIIFLVVLLWCLQHKDSEEPIFMAIAINVTCIFLDIISIAVYYDSFATKYSGEFKFSAGMSIINLLLRPATSLLLLKHYNETMGRYNNLGFPAFGIGRGPYEDIDQPATQSVPKTTVDTGSPMHHDHLSDSHIPPYPPTQ